MERELEDRLGLILWHYENKRLTKEETIKETEQAFLSSQRGRAMTRLSESEAEAETA